MSILKSSLLLLMSVITFGLVDDAEACSLGPTSPWVQPLDKTVAKAPEIVVVRVTTTTEVGGGKFDYAGKVVKTLKGSRKKGETVTVTLESKNGAPAHENYFMKTPDCKTVGGLQRQSYVILMPGMDNQNAVLEVKSPDDPKVAEIAKLVHSKRGH